METIVAIIGTILLPAGIYLFDQNRKAIEEKKHFAMQLFQVQTSVEGLMRNNNTHFDLILEKVKDLSNREDDVNTVIEQRFLHVDSLIADMYQQSKNFQNEMNQLKKELYMYQSTVKEAMQFMSKEHL